MVQNFDIIINRRGGTVLRDGEAVVETNLRAAFGAAAGSIHFVEGREVASAVREWLVGADREGRNLVIGGGDGTLLAAAEQVLNKDVTLGVLPLGTQNFVARNLGFSPDYRQAAEQLTKSVASVMDVGCVNGHYFLYGFVMGKAVDLLDAREAARSGDHRTMLQKAFSFAAGLLGGPKQKLAVTDAKGREFEAEGRLFAVTNNAFAPRSNLGQGLWKPGAANMLKFFGNAFAKPEQGDGQLAFYAHKGGAGRLVRAFPKLWDGSWNRDSGLIVYQSSAFTIAPPPGAGAAAKVAINLDGETKETNYPLKAAIHPQALKLSRNPV